MTKRKHPKSKENDTCYIVVDLARNSGLENMFFITYDVDDLHKGRCPWWRYINYTSRYRRHDGKKIDLVSNTRKENLL